MIADDLRHDIRYATRTWLRAPGFTTVAVLTLALGIGATTAIFSVVNAVLLKPLPYPDADRLVRVILNLPADASPTGVPLRAPVFLSTTEVAELQRRATTLSNAGIAGPELVGLGGREEAARLQGARISASVLQMLRVSPIAGRLLDAGDEAPGAEPVMLISESAWRQYFGGAPGIIGRRVTLDSVLGPRRQTTYTVAGVMPAGFGYPTAAGQFWLPVMPPGAEGRGVPRGPVLGRLADGVSLEAASTEIGPLVRALRQGQRGNDVASYDVVREQDEIVAPVRPALVTLMVAVGFLLLIACINVANLLLARTAVRQREMAIRAALGAGRGRVIRLLLTESVMLSLLGALAGIGVAVGGVRLLRALATTSARFDLGVGSSFPRLNEIAIDGVVLAVTCAVAVITGLLFGMAPALRHARTDTAARLREGTGATPSGTARPGVRTVLVIAEIAAAMVLLVGGGLLLRSFTTLSSVSAGYDPSNVLTFQVSLPLSRYPDDGRLKTFAEDLTARLRAIPGVELAGYANQVPMVGIRDTGGGLWRTADANPRPQPGGPDARVVSHDYLRVMGIRVVAGRGFTEQDDAGQPRVVVINEALARREFAGTDPLGQVVYVGRDPQPWQIVGVVEDVRQFGLDREAEPQYFVDMRQWPQPFLVFPTGAYYVVRTAADPMSVVGGVRALVREVDAGAALFNVAPMDQIVARSVSRPRMYAVLLAIFAAVGVSLAVIGIYGVMAYSVAQRTREIGIRLALGARRTSVLLGVLRHSMMMTAAGMAIGLLGAVALSRYLEGMLFGVTPADVPTYAAVIALFAAVAAIAALVPARRAASVDPLIAIRYE
jgi:putative ABC transport system permease protein